MLSKQISLMTVCQKQIWSFLTAGQLCICAFQISFCISVASQQSLSVISVKTAAAAASYGFVINKYEQQQSRLLFSLKSCAQCGSLYTVILCTVYYTVCVYSFYTAWSVCCVSTGHFEEKNSFVCFVFCVVCTV